ncbi:DUF2630 family protein [Planosporangium sp. 12N6]|uniref:DUF2630 family protein n=1 Tax=Planosporangium spinosum TaxID=3402278 RepID=UPI003CE92661
MDENSILEHIHHLVDEERTLRSRVMAGELSSDEEQARLRQVEKSLDQLWDLMRRRRAARHRGDDPDAETARPTDEVEGYLQ